MAESHRYIRFKSVPILRRSQVRAFTFCYILRPHNTTQYKTTGRTQKFVPQRLCRKKKSLAQKQNLFQGPLLQAESPANGSGHDGESGFIRAPPRIAVDQSISLLLKLSNK